MQFFENLSKLKILNKYSSRSKNFTGRGGGGGGKKHEIQAAVLSSHLFYDYFYRPEEGGRGSWLGSATAIIGRKSLNW